MSDTITYHPHISFFINYKEFKLIAPEKETNMQPGFLLTIRNLNLPEDDGDKKDVAVFY